MFEKISQWFDRGNPQTSPDGKQCDHFECTLPAEHRAPRSRDQLERGQQDWLWFCLDHVRDYNAKWNYYQGMSEAQQLEERLSDVVWQRPSWPLGNQGQTKKLTAEFDDPLGIFEKSARCPQPHRLSNQQYQDMDLLGMSEGFSADDLTKAYRALAKQYHPDTNKSPDALEKFRAIKDAYERLKAHPFP
ncbi:MAG: DnaJ domain-containing protein [Candidatus Paracaedibacteraceae bacterium]|nr:DnaJ domain-containing protein [Candidatus Paracaedibacteraceae bacterium]